ncbi:4-hydroxybenzoate polyprenyltransferase [Tranquillimonas alkanivorans]|uniref:4-hydroxybenzoate polyprenyltransferase n=1 Tax=Tranquillimonas alkanivorans TaxID=441119 RepID=A0A1I5VUL9_9RHOB|nr:4-hydroxybenzoate polyprenyltransferase [Tranquillimonas alkanivorans]
MSNLPTVWTNALAGAVLAGGAAVAAGPVLAAAVILSLFYVGGMWLNDAFDAEIDAAERSARPIPLGEIGRGTVFAVGGGLLALGVLAGFASGPAAGTAALALAGAVLLYDWVHKRTVLSPVIMGTTRFLCYLFAALALGPLPWPVLVGALGLFAYVVGLTYAAKQEAYDRLDRAWPLAVLALPLVIAVIFASGSGLGLVVCAGLAAVMAAALRLLFRRAKGDVPKAVVTLIAGISLYDAALVASAGLPVLALLAVAAFGLTLLLQRVVPGT